MKDFFHKLLDYFKINEEQYFYITRDIDFSTFLKNNHFQGIENVQYFLLQAIKNKKKIMVYGDYDADGIMGASIIKKTFSYLNYNIGYYIPSRYLDGYGLNIKNAEKIVEKKYDIVILVDNGISAFEGVDYLKSHGVNVIVLDHHSPQDKIVCADFILHPLLSSFSNIATSGAFIAFILSYYLLGYYDKYLSILAAISLISDMMPLLDFNRDLLRIVFSSFKENEFLPIDLLKGENQFNEITIGVKIAPKINAVGRIIKDNSINYLVEFFTSDDASLVKKLFNWINETNEKRKEISNKVIEESTLLVNNINPAIIIKMNIDEGMLGLIANRLLRIYKKTVVIFTDDSSNSNLLKGSIRTLEGANVISLFEQLKDILISYGGHTLAGGLIIKKSDFEDFKNKCYSYFKEIKYKECFKEYIEFGITELTLENYYLLQSFAPFGESWPEPNLKINNIKTSSLTYSRNNEHIVSSIGMNTRLVGFNFSKNYIGHSKNIDLIGTMRTSFFKGETNLEFVIKDIKKY